MTNVVILITNGLSTSEQIQNLMAAKQLKRKAFVFVIGMGDRYVRQEGKAIASKPSYLFHREADYWYLSTMLNSLPKEVCSFGQRRYYSQARSCVYACMYVCKHVCICMHLYVLAFSDACTLELGNVFVN